jgi:hypothetical protein
MSDREPALSAKRKGSSDATVARGAERVTNGAPTAPSLIQGARSAQQQARVVPGPWFLALGSRQEADVSRTCWRGTRADLCGVVGVCLERRIRYSLNVVLNVSNSSSWKDHS